MNGIDSTQNAATYETQDFRCLQLIASVFTAFRDYWGLSTQETLDIFKQNNIYDFIRDNFDFYHTVGKLYIVEDVRECLNLPIGQWSEQ